MPDSSVAIFFSAPVRNRANDNDYPYHQDPDFYYFSGFEQAECILLIFKNPILVNGQSTNEILYVAPKNKDKETWTGIIASPKEASSFSGIQMVLLTSEFWKLNITYKDFSQVLYRIPTGVTNDKSDTLDLFDLVDIFKNKFSFPPPNGDTFLLRNYSKRLREIKQSEEISLIKKAINMSCDGHKEMMRTLQPGMTEYQVQSVGEYVFKNNGAEDVGYPSICGGGENSCILHYDANRKKLEDGDLILLDMGAEYHGYSADVTRTLPVNGKFNPEQKNIYDLVKEAQDSAFEKCKPGNGFREPHQSAVNVISNGLVALGIIDKKDD
jgi:Xaa-Pro aminopeptidase